MTREIFYLSSKHLNEAFAAAAAEPWRHRNDVFANLWSETTKHFLTLLFDFEELKQSTNTVSSAVTNRLTEKQQAKHFINSFCIISGLSSV